MSNILSKIVYQKKLEVDALKQHLSISDFEKKIDSTKPKNSIITSISNSKNGIIAEFKRRSPSKPQINFKDSVLDIANKYQKNNAAAMSVLTDTHFFGGSSDDLIQAKSIFKNPILRKDFIVSEFQIYQSKAMGVDVILLIAAILSKDEISHFCQLASQLNLEVLIEIHEESELQKIAFAPNILYGINNRNLKTFEVDFDNSIRLCNKLPKDSLKIAESGIHNTENILILREKGFSGFLIGEHFMKMELEGNEFSDFINQISI